MLQQVISIALMSSGCAIFVWACALLFVANSSINELLKNR
jgi:energy-converting hydrogenase Eha subunit C